MKFARPRIEGYTILRDHKTRIGQADAYHLATYRQPITQRAFGLAWVLDGGSREKLVLLGQFIERQSG